MEEGDESKGRRTLGLDVPNEVELAASLWWIFERLTHKVSISKWAEWL